MVSQSVDVRFAHCGPVDAALRDFRGGFHPGLVLARPTAFRLGHFYLGFELLARGPGKDARGDFGIAGQLLGGALGFALGGFGFDDDLLGGITVLRLQAKASAGFGIDAIELSGAFAAIDQTETVLHRLSSSLEEK